MVLVAIISTLCLVQAAKAGVPSPALYFEDQLIDHLDSDIHSDLDNNNRWTQRYYASSKYFAGPEVNSPIFLIMGGEEEITPETGLMYPFVVNNLAEEFGAYVVQPEHRFYGESQPLPMTQFKFDPEHRNMTTALMTSDQAMWDAVRLVRHVQTLLGCSLSPLLFPLSSMDDHGHADKDITMENYCPVITVGGSYPGFLSAAMRLRHPDVVDMAYAASAPMKFYAQQVHVNDYYNHITKVAEETSPGCKNAVRHTLVNDLGGFIEQIQNLQDLKDLASSIGICHGTIPSYITNYGIDSDFDLGKVFYDELIMVIGYTFANYNMGNYPPGRDSHDTNLYRACQIFQDDSLHPEDQLAQFLVDVHNSVGKHTHDEGNMQCFNMTSQLPSGDNATITAGDWSGVGNGRNGQMWDFQTCDLLVEQIGFGPESMFPPRTWTMEWMNEHCHTRFGILPSPQKLVEDWGIDDVVRAGATKILFTNGLNDGWSVGGIQHDLSDSILALNFESGAHHSDLSGVGPSSRDTPDIKRGFEQITEILREWLNYDELGKNHDRASHHLRKRYYLETGSATFLEN